MRAIYNIKMNRLILAPAAVVWSLSRLMQMNQITVCLEAILRQNTVSVPPETEDGFNPGFLLHLGSYPPG